MAWTTYDGDVPVLKALRSILRWRTTLGEGVDPANVSRWKHTWRGGGRGGEGGRERGSQERRGVGHACGEMGAEDGWVLKLMLDPPQKEDLIVALMKMMRQPTAHFVNKTWRYSQPGDERS